MPFHTGEMILKPELGKGFTLIDWSGVKRRVSHWLKAAFNEFRASLSVRHVVAIGWIRFSRQRRGLNISEDETKEPESAVTIAGTHSTMIIWQNFTMKLQSMHKERQSIPRTEAKYFFYDNLFSARK